MKSLFEQIGGTYHEEKGYLIPNLTLPDEPEQNIGVWGPVSYTHLIFREPENRLAEGVQTIIYGLYFPYALILKRPATMDFLMKRFLLLTVEMVLFWSI